MKDMVSYLKRQNAYRVIKVLKVLKDKSSFRGKNNLGRASGAERNDYAVRPVNSAVRLNLIDESFNKGAYIYSINDYGKSVLEAWENDV